MGTSKSRSTLISSYSDIYHIEYGKNIISIFHAIDISLNSDTCHIAYGIVSRHDEITLLAIASNSDCLPFSPHADIQPRQSKHDSGHPRAKIIATRLQYTLSMLARLIMLSIYYEQRWQRWPRFTI